MWLTTGDVPVVLTLFETRMFRPRYLPYLPVQDCIRLGCGHERRVLKQSPFTHGGTTT